MILGIKITTPSYRRPRSGSAPPPPTNLILLENGVDFILLEGSTTDKIELE
mgnify:CR=1 FL=1|jgi:hypothetical protein|tara:strand:+ start:415 stop:567 length:153 start_codon:yes stop_codon:yes gene_type:complete